MNSVTALVFINMLHVVRVEQIAKKLITEHNFDVRDDFDALRTILSMTYLSAMTNDEIVVEFLRMHTISVKR